MDKVFQHSEICKELNNIYAKKNHDYNDSFSKTFEEYGMVMSAIRLEDKLTRFKNLIKNEAKVDDESLEDTLKDLANYAIMTLIELNLK
jgi:isopropylmalate/homocitrate/citramalate synthase